jgi:hypothetical protein
MVTVLRTKRKEGRVYRGDFEGEKMKRRNEGADWGIDCMLYSVRLAPVKRRAQVRKRASQYRSLTVTNFGAAPFTIDTPLLSRLLTFGLVDAACLYLGVLGRVQKTFLKN